MPSYDDAVGDAFTRLRTVGFEHGPSFVNHAPMAAEALAHMGYADEVAGWLERNLRRRSYHEAPQRLRRLAADDPGDWGAALGDFSRVADWAELFDGELREAPWQDVLARWWPRLLPGLSAALTHGVIRTAHAVRALSAVGEHNAPEREELARGLGYWAARFPSRRVEIPSAALSPADLPAGNSAAEHALDALVAEASGHYAAAHPSNPIPLIHAVTAPAAVRLVCPHLPEEQRRPSYLAALDVSRSLQRHFGGAPAGRGTREEDADTAQSSDPADLLDLNELFAAAVEIGDEHAIKLAEVAVRHQAQAPDPRYAAAVGTALHALRRFAL